MSKCKLGMMFRGISSALLLALLFIPFWGIGIGPSSSLAVEAPPRLFGKIILVSYDGVSTNSMEEAISEGVLPNLASLRKAGAQLGIRLIDHITKTDPGLAEIETGYGPDVTGIKENYFGESKSSEKRVIPNGLTISERIKAKYGLAWKTALFLPWTLTRNNMTGNEQSIWWNQLAETDYYFSSSNVTWSRSNQTLMKSALDFDGALMHANLTALALANFIKENANGNFYARIHFTEPDYIGHGQGDHVGGRLTSAYRQALIDTDVGLGLILAALRDSGIYDQTVVLVTTDHGFSAGHGGEGYPFEDHTISVAWIVSSYPGISNPLGWGLQDDIAPTVLALAGIDVEGLQPPYATTSRALPLWQANRENRETTPPRVLGVSFNDVVRAGQTFNITLRAADESGIFQARAYYSIEGIGQWRYTLLTPVNSTTFAGRIGGLLPGRMATWYLLIVDASVSRNYLYYPSEGARLSFTVQPLEGPAPTTETPFIYIGVIVAAMVAVVGGLIFLRSRRTT